jgi:predicted amidohydrolase
MKIKIAVVQFEMATWQVEQNLAKMEKFIAMASKKKADLIVFPEDCVTGPVMKNADYVDHQKRFIIHFQKIAAKYKIDLVPGSWMEADPRTKGWYNTTYYIDRTGKIKGHYRKNHLWLSERSFLTPGHQIRTFNTRFGKIGLTICWDLMFPEQFRAMTKKGVQIVICPSHWTKALATSAKQTTLPTEWESSHVNALVRARAIENEIIMVYANLAGLGKYGDHQDEMIGQSQIAMPFFSPLKHLAHNQEEMFIQEVDTNYLKLAEKFYKIRSDLKAT